MTSLEGWSAAVREQLAPGAPPSATTTSPTTSLGPCPPGPLERQVTPVEDHHMIGPCHAGLVLFKACMGPAILFLPSGVKNAGLVSAVAVSTIVGATIIWCMLLLLDAARIARRQGKVITDFADVGEAAFGPLGHLVVNIAIVTSQLGVCTAYCVFVAENVQAAIFESYGGVPGQPDKSGHGQGAACGLPGFFADKFLVYYVILLVMPLLIPFTWVRQIRYFACTNLIASCLVILSVTYMIISFAFSLHSGAADSHPRRLFDPAGSLVYFGTSVYAFEGTCVLLPTERCMKDSSQCRSVVCCTMGIICTFQVLFAVLAYGLYGENTLSIITVSLSDGSALGGMTGIVLVQLAWVLEVFLTFPLQLFLPARILEPVCFCRGAYQSRRSGRKWTKNAIRSGLLVFCMAVSLGGYSSVDNLVSLIGALGCVPLALVYPALFHWKIAYGVRSDGQEALAATEPRAQQEGDDHRKPLGSAASDLIISVVGTAGALMTTVLAVRSWISSNFEFKVCVLPP